MGQVLLNITIFSEIFHICCLLRLCLGGTDEEMLKHDSALIKKHNWFVERKYYCVLSNKINPEHIRMYHYQKSFVEGWDSENRASALPLYRIAYLSYSLRYR